MVSTKTISCLPPTDTITDEQRRDFATRVRANTPGKGEKRQIWDILSVLSQERAVALTADLWNQHEPARRRREQKFRGYAMTSAMILLAVVSYHAALIFLYHIEKPPLWLSFLQFLAQINIFAGNGFMHQRLVSQEQPNSLPLLVALKDRRLTPLLVDAFGFHKQISGANRFTPELRSALIDLLPAYASTDAPPLDEYQQNILRGEIKRFARRLRKSTATVDDAEAEFVVAALRYLTEVHNDLLAQTSVAKNTAVVEKVADLLPDDRESLTRQTVREAATACLPLLQGQRQ